MNFLPSKSNLYWWGLPWSTPDLEENKNSQLKMIGFNKLDQFSYSLIIY